MDGYLQEVYESLPDRSFKCCLHTIGTAFSVCYSGMEHGSVHLLKSSRVLHTKEVQSGSTVSIIALFS